MHHIIWRENCGRKLEKGEALLFIDGDKNNCVFENLKIESRKAMLEKVRVQSMPKELKEVVYLKARISRLINEGERSE